MEIYLDANATTPVIPEARAAALFAMAEDFGNPSSVHGAGLKARVLIDGARDKVRQVLGTSSGHIVFTSGATEGIQTAVLSALTALRARRDAGETIPGLVLYGATEHKAVPQAVAHWNALLGLKLDVQAIPVGHDGRHDLAWLREHAPSAGLVCTMAANNETGVISDLEGIAAAIAESGAYWLVDGVQALGKLSLRLREFPIDYAPFSGHKLYAPKGVGILYVRERAPYTPLIVGGGQEDAYRSGTENMAGIAAFGAVLSALHGGRRFQDATTLAVFRDRLAAALVDAFPGLVFNAPPKVCLSTTLNFSVPGVGSSLLLDLFDAAGIRVSGGSACGASKAQPSYVLKAMGLPAWQTSSAVRMSFGPVVEAGFIDEACSRIRACGESFRASCLAETQDDSTAPTSALTRHVVDGACCYVIADAESKRCVVVDPLPELTGRLSRWIACKHYELVAILDTHSHGDHVSSSGELKAAVLAALQPKGEADALGWPESQDRIELGAMELTRLAIPGHTQDSTAYLVSDGRGLRYALVGDTVMPGALGRSDFEQSEPLAFGDSLRKLEAAVGRDTLLLPGHDYENRFTTTLRRELAAQPLLAGVLCDRLDDAAFAIAKAELEEGLAQTEYQTLACGARVDAGCSERVELDALQLAATLAAPSGVVVVDVREPYEQRLSQFPEFGEGVSYVGAPLSQLFQFVPGWLAAAPNTPIIFFCRSGNRSAQAARALRRLGRSNAWSLAGGLALWKGHLTPSAHDASAQVA